MATTEQRIKRIKRIMGGGFSRRDAERRTRRQYDSKRAALAAFRERGAEAAA